MKVLSIYNGFSNVPSIKPNQKFHMSHNASASIFINGKLEKTIEGEKFFNSKDCNLEYSTTNLLFLNYINSLYKETEWDIITGFGINEEDLNKIGFTYKKMEYSYEHHLAHANSSYFTSPFTDALILSVDRGGEDGNCMVFYKAEEDKIIELNAINKKFGLTYRKMRMIYNKHLMCLFSPGKFMGLVGTGKYNEEIYTFLKSKYDFILEKISLLSKYNSNEFNFDKRENIQIGKMIFPHIDLSEADTYNEYIRDFAYTFQKYWTECLIEEIKKYKDVSENFCIVGGCALNGITNHEIIKSKMFKNVHFVPWANDSGLSIGYGFMSHVKNHIKINRSPLNPFIGDSAYDESELKELEEIYKFKKSKWTPKDLAEKLKNDKIIGFNYDRHEIGPRALGHRSILANPASKTNKIKLNTLIKKREWFQPFAPIIIEEYADKYFELCGVSAEYMQFVCNIKREYIDKLVTICHYDNTTRPQTITKDHILYDVLKEFKRITGYPILVNTSFNEHGFPTMNYNEIGFDMLKRKLLDGYIIGEYIYELN